MFVGRAAELARLAAARERAPGVVLVVGEAGIGKTRLVGEFVSGIDAFVAEGGADPGCVAYAPFVPVLRGMVRHHGAALVPGGGRRGLARLLPELGEVEELPDLGRGRLFEEVLLLVERSAARRPLVLVLEDLHWADQASLDLLVFLARNLMAPGVLVVATSREPLRLPGAEVIRVPPLGREEVARLLGRDLRPARAALDLDAIVARSEGNPLFAEALADAGAATPASLRELLLAGAERLPAQGLDVLRIAAVAGRRTPHDVLRAVAGLDDLALDEALRPVVRARLLLVDGDGYTFRHALIRDAVYDDLLPGERRRLHARCAEAHPELAADHWYAAGDRRRAFEAAWTARRWERVLELWDQAGDGADHVHVLELAARDALCEGDAERAEELATRALEEVSGPARAHPADPARVPHGDPAPAQHGDLAHGPYGDPSSRAYSDPLRAARLLELRVAIRDLLGEEGLDDLRAAVRLAPRESRLIGALATLLAWNGQDTEARTHAEEALALGDTRSLTTLAALTALDGDLGAASSLYAEARATAPDDDSLLMTYASEADVLEAAGKHARAESVAREGIARARRLGLARSRGGHLAANLAEPLASMGRWKEAREVMRTALALDPPPIHRAWILMVLGTIAVWEGTLGEAEEIVARVRPLMRGRSRGYDSCLEPDLLECRLALAARDPRRAGRMVDHVLAGHDLRLSRRYAWPLLALAAGLGRVRTAPTGLATTGRVQQAHRATFEAECGGPWEAAVASWRAVGQPYALGQALVRAAEQDPEHARERLREAVAIAGDLGSQPLRDAAEAAAATLRVSLGEELLLSAREREVLGLVAEGLSNRQIAERLFISARTSGVHVSNIMAKLGAASRVEAVARARRTGLI
ncbi:ATP-binding protein [Nonomuraea gerenzanensis]|uniref:LuxR-family transcriptional regulator n=1 Tax=Nonomuraea gerenzanensis TaxID=93944 RepID=A0A1M4EMT0_9ACTN|nr:helix-turn-helix transcriptional regulator [Nonomuraea gerenzanensis]UBU11631.1 AAA family ATPase [Nonomuraea gerenzanensis]SBP00125.1 LuxR-family transcriptional regulator [Nonomuraea gerenzanensis]